MGVVVVVRPGSTPGLAGGRGTPGECVDAEGSSGLTGDLSERTIGRDRRCYLNGGGGSELIRFFYHALMWRLSRFDKLDV